MVTVNNYYNNIPVGMDLNNLPNTSSAGTTVGYQYDGLTEEDRFVQKVLQEHYDKVYKENLSHSDPMAYIESKYCDVTSPNFCSYMTEDQRSIAYRNEKRMLQTGGKYSAGFARYDYALRNYKDVYTGASRSTGYIHNTDKEKQYARSVVNQQISNLFSKNGISLSKQADLTFSIDPYTYQLTVSGNADRDTLSQIEKLLNEGDNAKNIWTHAWICMHDSDNEIVNSQANRTKANQYSLWHEVYETTGYDARNATYRNGTFIAEDGTDLLALFKEKAKNGAGYELYRNREEVLLLINGAGGSSMENAVDLIIDEMDEHNLMLTKAMCDELQIPMIHQALVHWMSHNQVDMFLYMIQHIEEEEQALAFAGQAMNYLLGGWYGMFGVRG